MQAIVGVLRAILSLDSAAFEKGVANVKRDANGLAKSLQSVDQRIGKFGSMLAAGFAGAGIGTALVQMKAAVASIGDIGDAAANLGLSTDEFQKLSFAFQNVGVTSEELTAGMERFVDAAGEAALGGGKLKEIFDRYGVSLTTSRGEQKSINELLRDFADVIRNAGSAQEQMTLARDVFGRGGGKYLEVLREGKGGLDQFGQAAIDAGVVIDEKLIARADEFDRKWNAAIAMATTRFKAFLADVVAGEPVVAGAPNRMDAFRKMNPPRPSITARDTDMLGYTPGYRTGGAMEDGLQIVKQTEEATKRVSTAVRQSTEIGGQSFKKLQDRIGETTTEIVKLEEAQSSLSTVMDDFGYMAGDVFDRLLVGGEKLSDVLRDVVSQLASSAVRNAFSMLFQTPQGGGTSPFQAVIGALAGSFAGGFAGGGTIPAGRFGLVGERGPELIAAGRSPLTVYPNEAFGAGGGTVYNIDARGSNMTEAQFRSILDERDRRLLSAVPATVRGARTRGTI